MRQTNRRRSKNFPELSLDSRYLRTFKTSLRSSFGVLVFQNFSLFFFFLQLGFVGLLWKTNFYAGEFDLKIVQFESESICCNYKKSSFIFLWAFKSHPCKFICNCSGEALTGFKNQYSFECYVQILIRKLNSRL